MTATLRGPAGVVSGLSDDGSGAPESG